VQFKIPVSDAILKEVAKLDRFQGHWSAQHSIPAERLRRIREAAVVQSVASSFRLAGVRVSNAEVAGLLQGGASAPSDAKEILGYARALEADLPPDELLTTERVRLIHAAFMSGGQATTPSPWREQPIYREAFDAEGRATGHVFATLPPRLIEQATEKLITWLELELRSRERHPVLVIGAFDLALFSIGSFERGNCRLSRLLTNLLLRRAGYGMMPYASLESQIEDLRSEYHDAICASQTHLWTDEADLEPWLDFFLKALGRHRQRVETKIELERQVQDYPPLQRAILETIHEHGNVDAALLLKATGANRNTLKDNLRRLVQRGVLEKTGQRRGTRYHLATGEPPSVEH